MAGVLGGGDDDDFTFMSEARTRLSSLFHSSSNETEKDVNQSLMFVAPKQPKKNEGQTATSNKKMNVLHAIAIHTYKLENGTYSTHGKLGAAIIGDHEQFYYKLLLYKGKSQQVSWSAISIDFKFQVEPDLYAGFTDDTGSQWSLKFNSDDELKDFVTKIAFARANSSGKTPSKLIVQDLVPGEKVAVDYGDSLSISYTGWLYKNFALGDVFEDTSKSNKSVVVKLGKTDIVKGLHEGLLGAGRNTRRLLVVPPFLGYGTEGLGNVPPNCTLVYDVLVKKIKVGREGSTSPAQQALEMDTRPHVPPRTHSISEDTSIRSRGASISEQLTQRELELERHTPSPKSITKVSAVQSDPQIHEIHRKSTSPKPQSPFPQTSNVMYSYSNTSLHGGEPVPYVHHALAPHLSSSFVTSVMPSVVETHMPLLVSETRTQNTEVRLMLGKITDKLDMVLPKLDEIKSQRGSQNVNNQMPFMESSILMHNIERIVQENVQLKKENDTKTSKIQELNEKVCDILQRNQRFFEESNSILEQRSDSLQMTTSQLQGKVLNLEQEKVKLSSELNEAIADAHKLQFQLAKSEKLHLESVEKLEALDSNSQENVDLVSSLKNQITEITKEKELLEAQVEHCNVQNEALSSQLLQLQSKLKEADVEKKDQHTETTDLPSSENLDELKTQLATEIEKGNRLKKKHETFQENTRQMRHHYDSNIEILMSEIKGLKSSLRGRHQSTEFSAEIKRAMNTLYKSLQGDLSNAQTYSGSEVLEIMLDSIRRVTLSMISSEQAQSSSNMEISSPKKDSALSTKPQIEEPLSKPGILPEKPTENHTLPESTATAVGSDEADASETSKEVKEVAGEPAATELSNVLSPDENQVPHDENITATGDGENDEKEMLTVEKVDDRKSPDCIRGGRFGFMPNIAKYWKSMLLVPLLACVVLCILGTFVDDGMETAATNSTTFR